MKVLLTDIRKDLIFLKNGRENLRMIQKLLKEKEVPF